ncbi:MAG: heme exporter protein CcmB [Bacteroidota bacterium]
MGLSRQIWELLVQQIRSESRDQRELAAVLLYAIASVVLLYSALNSFPALVWNALFWIALFFASVSGAGRTLQRESGRRHLYWYSLVSPEALLIAKLIYNTVLLMVLGGLIWGTLTLLSNTQPLARPDIFALALISGSFGLATTFTFLAALSMRAGGGGTLLTILSFPLLIPLLILLVRAGQFAIDPALAGADEAFLRRLALEGGLPQVVTLLFALDFIILAAALILFPFVWRD